MNGAPPAPGTAPMNRLQVPDGLPGPPRPVRRGDPEPGSGAAGPGRIGAVPSQVPTTYALRVHRGRRGRITVARIAAAPDAEAHAAHATARSRHLGARWLVVDLSAVWAGCDAGLPERLAHGADLAGVGLALVGADEHGASGSGTGHRYPVFATVPIALGTLGAV